MMEPLKSCHGYKIMTILMHILLAVYNNYIHAYIVQLLLVIIDIIKTNRIILVMVWEYIG